MLTLKDLKEMEPDTIFANGETVDSPEGINMDNTGQELRWVAVRGGIHDWAIYCDLIYRSGMDVKNMGNKVTIEANIKKLVPCDDEAFKMYRY